MIPTIIPTHRDKKSRLEIEELCLRFESVLPDLEPNQIYFPLNVPSSKNSRSGGFDNPLVTQFYRKMAPFLLYQRGKWINSIKLLGSNPYPLLVTYDFRRSSARDFDYGNAIETVNDLLDGKKYFSASGKKKGQPKNLTWVHPEYREKLTSPSDIRVIEDDNTRYLIPCPDPRGHHIHKYVEKQGCIVSVWSREYWFRMLDDPSF